jgi:hypothetical protein
VLRKVFGFKREELQVAGENYILRNFMIYTYYQMVSLCVQANAEMVPKIPSCHYMLLM